MRRVGASRGLREDRKIGRPLSAVSPDSDSDDKHKGRKTKSQETKAGGQERGTGAGHRRRAPEKERRDRKEGQEKPDKQGKREDRETGEPGPAGPGDRKETRRNQAGRNGTETPGSGQGGGGREHRNALAFLPDVSLVSSLTPSRTYSFTRALLFWLKFWLMAEDISGVRKTNSDVLLHAPVGDLS